jgi:hypothetical protein
MLYFLMLHQEINRHQIKQYEKYQKKNALIPAEPTVAEQDMVERSEDGAEDHVSPATASATVVHARVPALPPEEGRQAAATSAPIASAFAQPLLS